MFHLQAGLQKKQKIALDVPCRSAATTAEVSDFHWHLASSDKVRLDCIISMQGSTVLGLYALQMTGRDKTYNYCVSRG